ncbi:MAG: radical SAM peptide maturase [Tannerella sp.]|jgi:uncharacterized protein|nr:radical SAM peptide maturase [Tannerella sp.]
MINYCFNDKECFLTPRKDYRLLLQRTDNRIQIIKRKKIPDKDTYCPDRTNLHSGHITAEGVYRQLANIRQIGFEVTDACNLQCTYCAYRNFYDDFDKRENQYMDIKKAKLLIDFVTEKSNTPANKSPRKEILVNFYGGEPLLNMDFISEMVSYAKRMENDCVKFRYNMTTNGVLLKKYLTFFIQYDFDILVSLDGSKEHDAYRLFHNGKSSFDTVYGNMIFIRDNYPFFFEQNILFNTVLHNLNNRQEVFNFFRREFNKVPSFAKVTDVGIKPGKEKEFDFLATPKQEIPDDKSEAEMKRVMDLNYDKTEKTQQFIFLYSGNKYNSYNDLLLKKENFKCISSGTCFPFSRKIFMTVNNKLFPCEKVGHQFSFGEVTDKSVNINCEEVAQKYNGYCDSLSKLCKRCYCVGSCMVCMYAVKDLGKKPVCKSFVNKKQEFDDHLHKGMEELSKTPELYKRIMDEIVKI